MRITEAQRLDRIVSPSESSPLAAGDVADGAETRIMLCATAQHDVPSTLEGWADRSDALLIEYLVERYHRPLRAELPRLVDLAERAAEANDQPASRLVVLLRDLSALLVEHLDEEEEALFPAVLAGALDGAGVEALASAAIDDHRVVTRHLEELRILGGDLSSSSPLRRALAGGLATLERELLAHIRLELDVLIPRLQLSLRPWRGHPALLAQ